MIETQYSFERRLHWVYENLCGIVSYGGDKRNKYQEYLNALFITSCSDLKKTDLERKIRIIFNASFRTKNGSSLNDLLLPGPKLQSNLWLMLTCWRTFRFAFCIDIVKIFWYIIVYQGDANLQRILWRRTRSPTIRYESFIFLSHLDHVRYYLSTIFGNSYLAATGHWWGRFPWSGLVVREYIYVDNEYY